MSFMWSFYLVFFFVFCNAYVRYLAMESTGAVVCVLDATTQNLRTSKAIRVVQEMRDSLKANAIGVFSKTDLTRDSNWRDKVGADFKSPFYKVENWYSGL